MARCNVTEKELIDNQNKLCLRFENGGHNIYSDVFIQPIGIERVPGKK